MKHQNTLISLILLLSGAALLSGCNTTSERNQSSINTTSAVAVEADYMVVKRQRAAEDALISELRINGKNLDAMLELAKLRETMGQKRLARLGYRQLVKASVPATEHNEAIKRYAAERLAVLRSDVVKPTTMAVNNYRF